VEGCEKPKEKLQDPCVPELEPTSLLVAYRRSSAFICGQYLVLISRWVKKRTYWPLMNADQRR
jgi:hypothetical protein